MWSHDDHGQLLDVMRPRHDDHDALLDDGLRILSCYGFLAIMAHCNGRSEALTCVPRGSTIIEILDSMRPNLVG